MRAYRSAAVAARLSSIILVGLTSGWLAGCAGPVSRFPDASATEIATERYRQILAQTGEYYRQRTRIENVAFRVRTANARFCKDAVAAQIGLFAGTVRELPSPYRSVAAQALSLDWHTPRAIFVAADSPAALAGIAPGDDVLKLSGQPVPPRHTARFIVDSVKHDGTTPITLTIRRVGKTRTLTLYPVMGCSIPIELKAAPVPNAFATVKKIVVQSAILRVTRSDADLAVIIGHELAHANLGHIRKQQENALIGEIGGAVIDGGLLLGGISTGWTFAKHFEKVGAKAYSVAFEREADYVGAYYAARAGYDIAGVENIWRAMAQDNPASITLATTHPTSPSRFVFMRKTIAEIEAKERRHLPLLPELKKRPHGLLTAVAGF